MLKGKKVRLNALERSDLKQLMDWRNDPEMRKHFREYRELNLELQEKWYNESVSSNPHNLMFGIRRLDDNELLGCCGLVYIHPVYRHADLSLYIGWNNAYIDNEGYASEASELLFDYAFNDLGLNKVWTEIYTFDHRKKALYDKFGMSVDGVLRQNCFWDGKFWDSWVLSILAAEWRSRNKKE